MQGIITTAMTVIWNQQNDSEPDLTELNEVRMGSERAGDDDDEDDDDEEEDDGDDDADDERR